MTTKKYIHTLLASALLAGATSAPLMAVDRGAKLFKENCALCHGEGGTPTAVGLSLHARNLTTEAYKQGETVANIIKTLETGVPGTGMAAFPYLSDEDRNLVAEYVYHLKHGTESVVDIAKSTASQVVKESKAVVSSVQAKVAPVVESVKEEVHQVVAKVEKKSAPVVAQVKEMAHETSHVIKSAASEVKQQVAEVVAKVEEKTASKNAENPLITEGRTLYKKGGCVACHGENGQADSPMGKMMKARNFVVDDYKMGATIEGISGVLQNGLPGTAMAAFLGFDAEQRKAIATFLIALKGHPEVGDSPEPKVASGSGKTSIAFAMATLAETPRHTLSLDFQDGSAGADVYAQNCASCHGAQGQGGITTRMVSAAPYYRVKTEPLLGHDGNWMKEANFKKIVLEGTPGKLMPGMGTLTQQELSDLYSFFKSALEKAK